MKGFTLSIIGLWCHVLSMTFPPGGFGWGKREVLRKESRRFRIAKYTKKARGGQDKNSKGRCLPRSGPRVIYLESLWAETLYGRDSPPRLP